MASVTIQDDVTILQFGPRYDSLDEAVLMDAGGVLLSQATHAQPPKLLLDLSQTEFIGSRFIELLVRTWKRLQERGGRMVLCGLQPFCAEVLQTTRLNAVWQTADRREEGWALLAEAGGRETP